MTEGNAPSKSKWGRVILKPAHRQGWASTPKIASSGDSALAPTLHNEVARLAAAERDEDLERLRRKDRVIADMIRLSAKENSTNTENIRRSRSQTTQSPRALRPVTSHTTPRVVGREADSHITPLLYSGAWPVHPTSPSHPNYSDITPLYTGEWKAPSDITPRALYSGAWPAPPTDAWKAPPTEAEAGGECVPRLCWEVASGSGATTQCTVKIKTTPSHYEYGTGFLAGSLEAGRGYGNKLTPRIITKTRCKGGIDVAEVMEGIAACMEVAELELDRVWSPRNPKGLVFVGSGRAFEIGSPHGFREELRFFIAATVDEIKIELDDESVVYDRKAKTSAYNLFLQEPEIHPTKGFFGFGQPRHPEQTILFLRKISEKGVIYGQLRTLKTTSSGDPVLGSDAARGQFELSTPSIRALTGVPYDVIRGAWYYDGIRRDQQRSRQASASLQQSPRSRTAASHSTPLAPARSRRGRSASDHTL